MVPFNPQYVTVLQKDIAKLVRDAQLRAPNSPSRQNEKFAGQFGGQGQQGPQGQADTEGARKRGRAAVDSCISIAKQIPIANTTFNWTTAKDFQRKNIGQTVVEVFNNPDLREEQFRGVQAALESELERYKPLTCPRRPLIKRIVECFRNYGETVYGASGGTTKSAFGGGSASDAGFDSGTFGGSGSASKPVDKASECIAIVHQIGGINFRYTKVPGFDGQNIAAKVASALWSGGPKPSASSLKLLRDAVQSEAENIPNGEMGSLLASLASCLDAFAVGA